MSLSLSIIFNFEYLGDGQQQKHFKKTFFYTFFYFSQFFAVICDFLTMIG